MAEIKEKKKLKLWQKLLIILGSVINFLLLLFIIFVIALSIKGNKSNSTEVKEHTTSIYENVVGWDEGEDDFVETDSTTTDIKLTDKALDEFENYIASYSVNYKYGDAYRIDEAIEYMNNHKVNSTTHKHDIRVDGKLDVNEFYTLIKSNNKDFMNDDNNSSKTWYEEYPDKKLNEYCTSIVEMLNGIHEKYPQTDMDELCCYLYDLKILDRKNALDFAAIELDKKILHINEDMLEDWADLKKNERMPEEVLHHEMMHLFQVACDCNRADDEKRIGLSHTYDGLEINPFRWYWLAESSAEMNACEYLDMDFVTYQAKIGYAETLNYILNLGNTDKAARVQELYFDRNADIYELFDMTSNDEKEEFIKMMYSIEILQQDSEDFIDWYSEKYDVDMIAHDQEKIKLHLDVKNDALITLTKMFYRNLARQINTGNATLQDVYYLMRIYECDLQNHLSNKTVSYMVYFKDLYPQYLEIRDEFFKAIAKENNISVDKISEDFENYSMNIINAGKKISPNCTLNFLSAEQKQAVNDYCKRIYKKGYPNMTEAYDMCKEWLEKAPYENVVFDY